MKKFLSALAFVLVLAGCSNTPKEQPTDKPAAIATLDTATFVSEVEKTENADIRVYFGNPEDLTAPLADLKLGSEDLELDANEVKTDVVTALKELELTKAEDQTASSANPVFFVQLYTVLDSNYARFVVYTDGITVQTNEGLVNYKLDDAAAETLDKMISSYVELFTAEEE